MTQILYGNRLGRQGRIRLGCSAVLLDQHREKVLLTRRADNNQWCLPSGGVELGESVIERNRVFFILEIEAMEILPFHKQFILDTLAQNDAAYIR